MKRMNFYLSAWALAVILLLNACGTQKTQEEKEFNPEFGNYISAYTSGVISSMDPIKVKFHHDLDLEGIRSGDLIDSDLFRFSPKIIGNLYLEDKNTLRFEPEESMTSQKTYHAELALDKLFNVSKALSTFEFRFKIVGQSFQVYTTGFSPYDTKDLGNYYVEGYISTADYMEDLDAKKLMSAKQGIKELPVNWKFDDNPKKFHFTVDSIIRAEQESQVILFWDGKPLDIEFKGQDTIKIPSLGSFEVADVSVVQQPEQYVLIHISDPIREEQNLKGIVRFENVDDLKYTVESNVVKVFPKSRLFGIQTLKIHTGIKNIAGYKMEEPYSLEMSFEDIKPAVRMLGDGVIVPNSEGLIFPFEAVNLKAVDFLVVKIYENNIQQFLQRNRLDGTNELKRVGRPLLKKRIDLNENSALDLGRWNAFSVDLAELIKDDPGAIYQVELSFKNSYSLFHCTGSTDNADENLASIEVEEEIDDSEWDYNEYYYSYYYYRPPGYRWQERDNPCHVSYYNSNRWVKRNVLASNLGIIAKEGNDRSLTVAVSDLLTTEPQAGVEVDLFNYQQQVIDNSRTDVNGFTRFQLEKKPFLLVASKGSERGYLRLDDGSSLSLSMFEVNGEVVNKGIKGFLYGERGVWRPGDTLYLNFILEDENNVLPENHPVTFELNNPQGQLVKRIVKTSGINGFYNFTTKTSADAPTGMWGATVNVGGSRFYKNIRIETVKPNRLKLNLEYDAEILSAEDEEEYGSLKVKWLHGATARNLKANVTVTLNTTRTKFDNFKDYVFEDRTKKFYSEDKVIFDDRVSAMGEAKVKSNLGSYSNAPGMLKANFMVRAFEEGGDFSTDFFSKNYAPYERFVGMKLPKTGNYGDEYITDSVYTAEVVTVDKNGNSVDVDKLEVTVVKMYWRWWWDVSYENIGNYVRKYYNDIISTQEIKTRNGKGKFDFKVEYPDWGRYLVHIVDPDGEHSSSQIIYVDWPSWVSRDNRSQPDGAKVIGINTDKDSYEVGDKAVVTFPVSGEGRALLSIENGSGVLDAYWVEPKTDDKEASITFEVTDKMCPNIYVHITYIQPHAQTANDLPIRLYGVKPVEVKDPETILYPVITMEDELQPENEFTVRISEKNNKKMTYTLAVVDDGLLDLTRFKTPDPWKKFYAKEALGVKTWDIYDHVLGAYGGKMEQLFAIGGDGEDEVGKSFTGALLHV